jgi:hypothetical protein
MAERAFSQEADEDAAAAENRSRRKMTLAAQPASSGI